MCLLAYSSGRYNHKLLLETHSHASCEHTQSCPLVIGSPKTHVNAGPATHTSLSCSPSSITAPSHTAWLQREFQDSGGGKQGGRFIPPWCYTPLSHISPSPPPPPPFLSFDIVCHYAIAFSSWRLSVWL